MRNKNFHIKMWDPTRFSWWLNNEASINNIEAYYYDKIG